MLNESLHLGGQTFKKIVIAKDKQKHEFLLLMLITQYFCVNVVKIVALYKLAIANLQTH